MSRPWWRDAVVYQIYIRSFADSDADGIGDLVGVRDRLEYLTWLGIDAIWITPFFESSQHDLGYDITDYCAVDPRHGRLADFDDLLAAAHRLDIKVIVDLVPNHTSAEHPWFLESRSSRTAAKRDWYWWRPGRSDGGPPNNWRGQVDPEPGGAWVFDEPTQEWYLANFSRYQPELNWANPQVRAAVGDVVDFWSRRGVDGFRLDMVDFLAKDPELTDEPEHPGLSARDAVARARHQLNRPESMDYVRELRGRLHRPAEQVLIGELIYHAPVPSLAAWGAAGILDLPLNFRLTFLELDARTWRQFIEQYDKACRSGAAWPTYCLGNHDSPRVGRLGERVRTALLILLTLRGTPFLYYGDELGLADSVVAPADSQDLWQSGSRDGARAPMPWAAVPGAGFTAPDTRPWLPVAEPAAADTVAEQRSDAGSTVNLVRRLLQLRRSHGALRQGDQHFVDSVPDQVLCFRRTHPDGDLTVVANLSDDPIRLDEVVSGTVVAATAPGSPGASTDHPQLLDSGQAVIVGDA